MPLQSLYDDEDDDGGDNDGDDDGERTRHRKTAGCGRGHAAMLSSDWLPGLPRSNFTTGAQCL